MRRCIHCRVVLLKRHQIKYCSNRCQIDYQHKAYINAWKKGVNDGSRGILTKNTSRHLKHYLVVKRGEHCSLCGWDKRHKKTGVVPLEIDHLDGNADNNKEKNLRLICPNCHSLTMNFRGLNMGKGRSWRSGRYIRKAKNTPDKTISF